jgi:hypothetical protein
MALPKWITPAGTLGIVPELEYYQYTLDAYDPSAGTLVYSLVSGRLTFRYTGRYDRKITRHTS